MCDSDYNALIGSQFVLIVSRRLTCFSSSIEFSWWEDDGQQRWSGDLPQAFAALVAFCGGWMMREMAGVSVAGMDMLVLAIGRLGIGLKENNIVCRISN